LIRTSLVVILYAYLNLFSMTGLNFLYYRKLYHDSNFFYSHSLFFGVT